jgi:hypothetical protein
MISRLTAEQLQRLRELFDAAIEMETAERSRFLEQACGADSVLRAELEQLLKAHSSSGGAWLDRPVQPTLTSPTDPAPDPPLEGHQIGPYHLLRQLGHGGMGTVYLAERKIGKRSQQVALKIVRPGLTANAEIIRRFEHEREILASLDHPNIARLLDIGSTADGVPYLVMDYVNGEPVDVYCDARKLTISERLNLFRTACAAIQYAHSKGVIHRDLKPSNMLVTSEGQLKLLDFGIAKVLNSEGQTQTIGTQPGSTLMTIEYASPEQIRGDTVGPPSDVYSLGVVLYELLTGCRPYRTEGRFLHVIARAICEEDPVTPSSAVCESATLLDKESPGEFSEDIRRHLAGERVTARRDTLRYRAEKILHRILYPSDGVFHSHGMLMMTAGLLGVLLLAERQAIAWGWRTKANRPVDIAAVTLWILWAMREGRRMMRAGKFSALDRQSWIVFSVITTALGLLTIISVMRPLISLEAMAIFWNVGLAIGLVVVGLQANRLMTAGGIALMLSALAAAFYSEAVYVCLAGGMLAGMVVPGFLLLRHGKAS